MYSTVHMHKDKTKCQIVFFYPILVCRSVLSQSHTHLCAALPPLPVTLVKANEIMGAASPFCGRK